MKPRDLSALLVRAAAALETPEDLTESDKLELIEDLYATSEEIYE